MYAVILDRDGKLLAVEYRDRYFLPGGGLNDGESITAALHRELMEETGMCIKIVSEIGTAAEYVAVPRERKFFNKIGHFYKCSLLDVVRKSSQRDHKTLWMTAEEFERSAAHESHVWAARSPRV